MLDLAEIEGFDWDEGNERKSQQKHSVSQGEAEQVFFSTPLFVLEDLSHSHVEDRFHGLGKTETGPSLHVTFTIRAKKIRVISARDMHRRERRTVKKNLKPIPKFKSEGEVVSGKAMTPPSMSISLRRSLPVFRT